MDHNTRTGAELRRQSPESTAPEPRCPALQPNGTVCPTAWCDWCRLERPEDRE